MFEDRFLRKDISIGFKNDTFQLLPAISINRTSKFFEITIGVFKFFIYICYSIHKYDEDD